MPSPELTDPQREALRRAIRVEWVTIVFLIVTIVAIGLVMGSSQAMRAAWIEDMLSLAPPIAFLLAVRIIGRPATRGYPYGWFRAVGVGHLVAGLALLAMGGVLVIDAVTGLVSGDRPPIGSVQLFGTTVWQGWLMIGVMALTIPLPVYLGRVKMRLAKQLHNKILYADADMDKADWLTAAGTIVGVMGIGLGLWWADAAVAGLIGVSILWDGIKNTRAAITDLMDTRATTFDDGAPHPDGLQVAEHLETLDWVEAAGVRMRDQGQFFHVEAFVVPVDGRSPTLDQLVAAREACERLDWKLHDVQIIPVAELSPLLSTPQTVERR